MTRVGNEQLVYHPLERLRPPKPVDRIDHIVARCRGLRVLDLGAYDETEITRKQHRSYRWLHGEIAQVAGEVLGIDSATNVRERGEVRTSVGSRIVHGSVDDLERILTEFRPDIIVAGELIEHTPNTLGWLTKVGRTRPGVQLIATTPNATSLINLVLAFLGRENNHPDHLHVYSYKTLATLAERAGLTDVSLVPYYYTASSFRGRVPSFMTPLVSGADLLIARPLQYLFPLTAFGLILEGRFREP